MVFEIFKFNSDNNILKFLFITVIFILYDNYGTKLLNVNAQNLFENCGKASPLIKNYIYGGKSTMIEQWPWQVKHINFFICLKLYFFNRIDY